MQDPKIREVSPVAREDSPWLKEFVKRVSFLSPTSTGISNDLF